MARRSLGVVLIVALLGWTVNQPKGCEGRHSRAAVTVLAGASPAYQPEPSPTRHSCCPRERQAATQPSPQAPRCRHTFSFPHDCCSMTAESSAGLPVAILTNSAPAKVALPPATIFLIALSASEPALSTGAQNFTGSNVPSFTALRL